jgi:hypothetical protein
MLRRGLPYGSRYVRGKDGKPVRRLRWFQILWPLKILTVLFHEVSPIRHVILKVLT